MSGPFFEDLVPGWRHTSAGSTLTTGSAAWYLAISGDMNPAHVDARVARRAGMRDAPISTALVAHTMIGQSTAATREVIANLFYRDVVFLRPVSPGSTIWTETVVTSRQEATPRADRPPRGKVMLEMTARDEEGRPMATMRRCALIRKAHSAVVAAQDDIDVDGDFSAALYEASANWASTVAATEDEWDGDLQPDDLLDPVTDALALVRATGNVARAHRDPTAGQVGRRLVYGGHTLSLAQASLSRSIGGGHVVVGWERCSHPAPVFEGDTLGTSASVQRSAQSHGLRTATVAVSTTKIEADAAMTVQQWMPVVLARG